MGVDPVPVTTVVVECLRCGESRKVESRPRHGIEAGECSRCGYLGWAARGELTEVVRRVLRERPPESRRLRAV